VEGENAVQRQFEGAVEAAVGGGVVLVEYLWSDVRAEGGGGEEIAAEEELVVGGVKAAVAVGVAGKGHDAEAAPDGQLVAIVEELVRTKGRHAEHATADPFGDAGDAAPTGVAGTILEVVEIALRSGDPGAVFAGERRRVEHMIEVAVREQDSTDGQMIPAAGLKGFLQSAAPAEEAGVDQIQGIAVSQDEELHDEGADDEEIGRRRRQD